jgi:tRNA uridine 5-carboxymethylaminomethyl modification enzyme
MRISMNRSSHSYDVIVVGAGHAGIEAAAAAARMGQKTLLLTLSIDRIGLMPCNPAVGGIGKGHIVFEIAALGGLMPQLCTKTYLQARMLNTRKGPAVQGLRLQIDKIAYNELARQTMQSMPNLTVATGMVEEIITAHGAIVGVRTREGSLYSANAVVITTGTFLNGLIHVGQKNYTAGRQGEEASRTLSDTLKDLGLTLGRLKTGTPPRLLKTSLDFSVMEIQESDPLEYLFEFEPHRVVHKQACYITHTTAETHQVIRDNFEHSPIFTGHIRGTPPRYCPSIEDKIMRFPDKNSHHIFVEPESARCDEIYPNGLSTSLPLPIQELFIRTIPGFEKAIIARPGYAVEYDFAHPNQLSHSLEVKTIPGLFLAGQINGTTGYEEAAGQGIIAGINAALKVQGKSPYIMSRTEGYIGIMIDDLVTFGVDEPYRMFTSRAERRLILRQDNVFSRLGAAASAFGLISHERFAAISAEQEIIKRVCSALTEKKEYPKILRTISEGDSDSVRSLIREEAQTTLPDRVELAIYAELLYGPYLARETREVEKLEEFKELSIPESFEYNIVPGLSKELQQKLSRYRPATIAHASLIQGMTPAAISLLIFTIRKAQRCC